MMCHTVQSLLDLLEKSNNYVYFEFILPSINMRDQFISAQIFTDKVTTGGLWSVLPESLHRLSS